MPRRYVWAKEFKVTSTGVTSTLEGYDTLYDDFEQVKGAMDSSLKAVNEDDEKLGIIKEWRTYVKHMDRRPGMVIFRKGFCKSERCRCSTTIKEPNLLPGSNAYLFPPITRDPNKDGHFKTYHQLLDTDEYDDIGLHFNLNSIGSCEKCRYVFSSESDKDRHILLVHKGKRAYNRNNLQDNPAPVIPPVIPPEDRDPTWKCQVCNDLFRTQYQLRKHRDDTGHVTKRGRPRRN